MTNLKNIYQFLLTDDSKDWDLANQILIGLRISKSHRLAILARGWAHRRAQSFGGKRNVLGANTKLRNLIYFTSKNPIKNIKKMLMYGEGELFLGRYKGQRWAYECNFITIDDYIMWLLKILNYIK